MTVYVIDTVSPRALARLAEATAVVDRRDPAVARWPEEAPDRAGLAVAEQVIDVLEGRRPAHVVSRAAALAEAQKGSTKSAPKVN